METIMRGFARASRPRRAAVDTSVRRIGRTLKRWWLAYTEWRIERLAIVRLSALSDRQLSDMGLSRSQIEAAIKGPADRCRLLQGRFS